MSSREVAEVPEQDGADDHQHDKRCDEHDKVVERPAAGAYLIGFAYRRSSEASPHNDPPLRVLKRPAQSRFFLSSIQATAIRPIKLPIVTTHQSHPLISPAPACHQLSKLCDNGDSCH